jgi:hypothetical protein
METLSTEATMETATRDAHGRFKPGCSGNPAGKKPGTLNKATLLKRWLDEDVDGANVARALRDKAVKGHVVAGRVILDRLDPKPRGRPIALDLPEGATPGEAFQAVFREMAAGAITPDEALVIARFLERWGAAVARDEGARQDRHARESGHPGVTSPAPQPATLDPSVRGDDDSERGDDDQEVASPVAAETLNPACISRQPAQWMHPAASASGTAPLPQ